MAIVFTLFTPELVQISPIKRITARLKFFINERNLMRSNATMIFGTISHSPRKLSKLINCKLHALFLRKTRKTEDRPQQGVCAVKGPGKKGQPSDHPRSSSSSLLNKQRKWRRKKKKNVRKILGGSRLHKPFTSRNYLIIQ